MRKKKCYIYTRVSTMAQTEGYSLEAQVERLREYAEYRNLQIVGEYCDAGKSGKSIKGRPAFQQIMEDVVSYLKEQGFGYITMDLQGLRSGSMDEMLSEELKSSLTV